MAEVALLVAGAIIGFAVNELLGRGLRSVDRRRAKRDPLVVHVETDPSIIWAGEPPWVGASFLLPPNADIAGPPPSHCPDWWRWARARGGVDCGVTEVRVTLSARESLLVVVDALRVNVHARRPVPEWRQVICGVGGADIVPKGADVQLTGFDPPTVSWREPGGEPMAAPTLAVTSEDAEMLHITGTVGDDEWVEWTAELFVLVDGERQVVEITDAGKPFITSGASGAVDHKQAVSGAGQWSDG